MPPPLNDNGVVRQLPLLEQKTTNPFTPIHMILQYKDFESLTQHVFVVLVPPAGVSVQYMSTEYFSVVDSGRSLKYVTPWPSLAMTIGKHLQKKASRKLSRSSKPSVVQSKNIDYYINVNPEIRNLMKKADAVDTKLATLRDNEYQVINADCVIPLPITEFHVKSTRSS